MPEHPQQAREHPTVQGEQVYPAPGQKSQAPVPQAIHCHAYTLSVLCILTIEKRFLIGEGVDCTVYSSKTCLLTVCPKMERSQF